MIAAALISKRRYLWLSLSLLATSLAPWLAAAPGDVDLSFDAGRVSGAVNGAAFHTNSTILVWGAFTNIGGVERRGLARLNADGSVDTSYDPDSYLPTNGAILSSVLAAGVMADGGLVVAGAYSTTFNRHLWRLGPDGLLDTNFAPRLLSSFAALAVQPDGKIVVATDRSLFRLDTNGVLDGTFTTNSTTSGPFYVLALQPDGKILLGGYFNNFAGQFRDNLVRVNANGTLDTNFVSDARSTVLALALQPDGRVIIGGDFVNVSGSVRKYVARLWPDGSLDPSLNSSNGANSRVLSIHLQPDDRILIGGGFSTYASSNRLHIARLNFDGSLDPTFDPGSGLSGPSAFGRSVLTDADGAILAGGIFTQANGVNRTNLARFLGGPLSAPSFASVSSNQAVFTGDDATLHARPRGLPAPGLQWFRNGDSAAATNWQLRFPSVQTNDAGAYVAVAINSLGAATSAVIQLTVTDPWPTISGQPSDRTVLYDQSAQFFVTATGRPPLLYQWWKDGSFLTGKTGASLTIAPAQLAQQGLYSVSITTVAGSITSAPARLTVITNPPGFSTNPVSQTVSVGQVAAFSAMATGVPPPTMQWQFNGTNLLYQNSPTLWINYATEAATGLYQVVASNLSGLATSEVAVLTVDPYPMITPQPQSHTVLLRRAMSFKPAIYGRPPLAAQWFHDGGLIPSATNAELAISDVGWSDAGAYQLVVSNEVGSVTSVLATLTLLPAPTNAGALDVDFMADATSPSFGEQKVTAVATMPDGRIVFGGMFESVNGAPRLNVARLLPSGGVDPGFDTSGLSNRPVRSLAVAPDGAVFIASNNYAGPWAAKLNLDGTQDSNYVAVIQGTSGAPPPVLTSVSLQADGKLLVAGRSALGNRLNLDGSTDAGDLGLVIPSGDGGGGGGGTLYPENEAILALRDERILFGVPSHALLVRRNALLWSDSSFVFPQSGASGVRPYAVAEFPDGGVVAVGYSSTNYAIGIAMKFTRQGAIDPAFAPPVLGGGYALSVALQSDGKILIGGSFTNVAGIPRRGIARLNVDGTVDQSFFPGEGISVPSYPVWSPAVNSLALQPDGHVIIGGAFQNFDGAPRTNLARLYGDPAGPPQITVPPTNQTVMAGADTFFNVGTPATAFAFQWQRSSTNLPGATAPVLRFPRALAADAGEYAVVVSNASGSITSAPVTLTVRSPSIDGALDIDFDTSRGADRLVTTMARQPDGRVIVGGYFKTFAGWPRRGIARVLPNGNLDTSFNPGSGINGGSFGRVDATLLLPDGKILIAGYFTNFNGFVCGSLARLNADGSFDPTFNVGVGATGGGSSIYALARQDDGKILVGGQFSYFQGEWRGNLVRVDTNGLIDLSFNPGSLPSVIFTLTRGPGGRILAGGNTGVYQVAGNQFFNPAGTAGFSVRSLLCLEDGRIVMGTANSTSLVTRLTADGFVDPAFLPLSLPSGSGTTRALDRDECGRILAAGNFRFTNGQGTVHGLLRLEQNGGIHARLGSEGFDGPVYAMSYLPGENRLLVAGAFGAISNAAARGLARLHLATPAPVFTSVTSNQNVAAGNVVTLTASLSNCPLPRLQWWLNGQPVAGATNLTLTFPARFSRGGAYFLVASNSAGTATSAVSLLTVQRAPVTPGALDLDFLPDPGVDGPVAALAVQGNGGVIVGGDFFSVAGSASVDLARLNPDGSFDGNFVVSQSIDANYFSGHVNGVAAQPDGQVLAAGHMKMTGSPSNRGLLRLRPDGALDMAFVPGFSEVHLVARSPDEKLLVSSYNSLVRLHTNGIVDTNFQASVNGHINALALLPDGRVLIAGSFNVVDGFARSNVACLIQNGRADPTFNTGPAANGAIYALAAQPDGKCVIVGDFTTIGGTARPRITRVLADGAPDAAFDPGLGANAIISAVALASDGKICVAGSFTNFNGFTRRRLARLLPNGAVDSAFDPGLGASSTINAMRLDEYGRIHIAGNFSAYGGRAQAGIARVHGDVFGVRPTFDGGTFSLRVMTAGGWTYHLERTAPIPPFDWQEVGSVLGDGSPKSVADPAPTTGHFYRLRVD